MKGDEKVMHCMMFLIDKHLYSTFILNQIVANAKANKSNLEGDIKCISNMIKWRIVIQKTLMNTIPKVFEEEKKMKKRLLQQLDTKGGIVRIQK